MLATAARGPHSLAPKVALLQPPLQYARHRHLSPLKADALGAASPERERKAGPSECVDSAVFRGK
jgi:hypothetical protein